MAMPRQDIAAVVVLYNPGPDVLDNITSYAAQVGRVIAIDNSEPPSEELAQSLTRVGVDYLPMNRNAGIATALNKGCRRALKLGYSWALTMDQDSEAPECFVSGLATCIDGPAAERVLIACPEWEQIGGLPAERVDECVDLDFVLTSGSLLRLSGFDALNGFRDDLFIDEVDHEFCLRARHEGWRIVRRRDVVLRHRMGTLRRVTFPIPNYIQDYAPVRYYYQVRNRNEVKRVWAKEFPGWLAHVRSGRGKKIAKLLLSEPRRLAKLAMMLRGWMDYRAHRFGRYEDLHP
jgi:rhamnosyltransferase